MKLVETEMQGLYLIETFLKSDSRGTFGKVYNKNVFQNKGIIPNFEEFFYSFSKKNVIRGMHFQEPPYAHEKLVFVIKGAIKDVVLDIRKNSLTYGDYYEVELSGENQRALFISKGFAHGFAAYEYENIVCYLTSSVYSKKHDSGIAWNSFGYDWKIKNPIISNKDKNLLPLKKYDSPFVLGGGNNGVK